MNQKSTILTAAAAGAVLLVFLLSLLVRYTDLGEKPGRRIPELGAAPAEPRPPSAVGSFADGEGAEADKAKGISGFSDAVLRQLIAALAGNKATLRREAVLRFKDEESYRKFLASLGKYDVRLLGSLDALRAVRLGFDGYQDFANLLDDLDGSETGADANYLVSFPAPPDSGASPGPGDGAVPFGRGALEALGISGDHSSWGEGVKVAVIDSGVQQHSVFGDKIIKEWNMVFDEFGEPLPIDPNAGHGTAIASIIGGADPNLPGVAPAAELLSFRILDNDGFTDSFSLAEAIIAATDAGASVINVSLGSTGDSQLVRDAVAYAQSSGALIVASAGNEGSGQVSYPAAIEGVVAVAASDARGEHLDFSNSGDPLAQGGLAAPGYGVLAAWPEEKALDFSGTSPAAGFVSGAVVGIMSQNPGMSAQQAYNRLVSNSNEAGAPGPDPEYGEGNLHVGRAVESGTPGIVDAAVASYYYDPVLAAENGTSNFAQVVVENRGTSALHNVSLEVNSGSGMRTYNISYLDAGEIQVINTPINIGAADAEGALGVSANVTLNPSVNGADRNTADNILQRVIDFTPAVEPDAADAAEEVASP